MLLCAWLNVAVSEENRVSNARKELTRVACAPRARLDFEKVNKRQP